MAYQQPPRSDKFNPVKPKWNDLPFLLLFYVQLAGFIVVAVISLRALSQSDVSGSLGSSDTGITLDLSTAYLFALIVAAGFVFAIIYLVIVRAFTRIIFDMFLHPIRGRCHSLIKFCTVDAHLISCGLDWLCHLHVDTEVLVWCYHFHNFCDHRGGKLVVLARADIAEGRFRSVTPSCVEESHSLVLSSRLSCKVVRLLKKLLLTPAQGMSPTRTVRFTISPSSVAFSSHSTRCCGPL